MSKHSEIFSKKKKEIIEKESSAREELERAAKETEEKLFNYLKFIGLISAITTVLFLVLKLFKKKKASSDIKSERKAAKPKKEYVPKKSTISTIIIERTIAAIFPMLVKAVTNSIAKNIKDKNSGKNPKD
jgi:H+/gluconate symporter-like permease